MRRGLSLSLMGVVFLTVGLGGASATTSWPSRTTPVSSTIGWFKAINAHDRKHLLYYVAAGARRQMGWAEPSHTGPKFTAVDCRCINVSDTGAHLRCTFKESGSPSVVGNSDTFWDVYLRRTRGVWLIESCGQG